MPTTVVVPFPPATPATPAGSDFEMEVNRRNTLYYIDTDPSDIAFRVMERVADGEGGHTWDDGGLLDPQRVRVVTSKTSTAVERRTVEGEVVTPDVMLITRWDANVAAGWTFSWDGDDYEIVYVNDDFNYQKHVEVITRG